MLKKQHFSKAIIKNSLPVAIGLGFISINIAVVTLIIKSNPPYSQYSYPYRLEQQTVNTAKICQEQVESLEAQLELLNPEDYFVNDYSTKLIKETLNKTNICLKDISKGNLPLKLEIYQKEIKAGLLLINNIERVKQQTLIKFAEKLNDYLSQLNFYFLKFEDLNLSFVVVVIYNLFIAFLLEAIIIIFLRYYVQLLKT